MGKPSKSTKKFLKKNQNPSHRSKGPRKSFKRKREEAAAAASDSDDENNKPSKQIEEMDIDEFLAGDFLNKQPSGSSKKNQATGRDDDDGEEEFSGSDDDSEPSLSDLEDSDDEDGSKKDRFYTPMSGKGDDEEEEDSESDDDDDDTTDGVGAQNKKLKSEIESHKQQLEKLKQQDPEFYAYLQATDKELLAFGDDSEDEQSSENEDEQKDEDADQQQEEEEAVVEKKKAQLTVTVAMVDTWCKAALESGSMNALKHIIKAYRVACHFGDSDEQLDEGMKIASSAVYNKLMLFVLKEIDGIFRRALGIEGKTIKASEVTRLARWKKSEPFIKSYLGNTLNLLGQMTDATMLAFILRRIRASVVFLTPYEKLQRRYIKQSLQLFGSAEASPRVQAILLVRQMALTLPQPALDNCLKGVYRAYSINSKFVNASSVPHINFMAASVVELYGINPAASYQHAFSFIRQLALLLRTALTSKTKDAFREVYCWQTINCLELWAKVLAAHADQPDMKQLIYPVSQLLLGAARLVPTPSYFPLRLRCALALNRLGQSTGVFMPVAPLLLEVLQWSDLSKSPKPTPGGKAPEPLLTLRASKTSLRSAAYQEEIINQVFEQLADHLAQWSCHVAFPELAHLPLVRLRKFVKTTPVERFRKGARQLVDAIERNIAFVGKARDAVEFSPKDLSQVGSFLAAEAAAKQAPLQTYSAGLQEKAKQRLQLRMAQDMLLDAVEDGKQKKGAAKRKAADSSDSDEEDEDDIEAPTGNVLAAAAAAAAAKQKAKPAAKRSKATADSYDEDEVDEDDTQQEDRVAMYQLSSDEEDDDDEQQGDDSSDDGGSDDDSEGGEDSEEEDDSEVDEDRGGNNRPDNRFKGGRGRGGRGGRGGGRGNNSGGRRGGGRRGGGRGGGRGGRR